MKATLIASVFRVCAIICLTSGCSEGGKHGAICGTVTLDGQPVKTGVIRFEPVDGQRATRGRGDHGRQVHGEGAAGEKRVSITSPKVVGQKKMFRYTG